MQVCNPASEFLRIINSLFGKGWHAYGPKSDDEASFFYISFHVNPENSDRCEKLLRKCINAGNSQFWFLKRSKNNRFYLSSKYFHEKAGELGSYEETIKILINIGSKLGIETAAELNALNFDLANAMDE
jgi:hypothetical protein